MSVGVLVVSYGSRGVSMVDALCRSRHKTKLFIVDKQKNPFNIERAYEHVVVPDLNVNSISDFAFKHKEEIEFCVVGPEGPVIEGLHDVMLEKTGIPVLCPSKEYAIEASKVEQRELLAECCPSANPRYRVFDPHVDGSLSNVKDKAHEWFDKLESQVVVKPDKPGFGKGVGVWGDHFNSKEDYFEYFKSNYESGTVIVEEKIDGEESSFMAYCDGKSLAPFPDTRDYKRAFEGDIGPNTGGMGSYKDVGDHLPFMTKKDREMEEDIVGRVFKQVKGEGRNEGLLGLPFYVAFIHTKDDPKVLEINSRPGDPEIMNIMPALADDYVDLCYAMLEGSLTRVSMKPKATVVTYKVPPAYGGYDKRHPDKVISHEIGGVVDLSAAYKLVGDGGGLRVFPGSMEVRDNNNYSLRSRTVACVGLGDSVEEARENSLEGIESIKGGSLWNRGDVASKKHIQNSIAHMKSLRG
ncbi:MAG: ATP-grasp domain-containing protein [Methanobacteriota archaeon]